MATISLTVAIALVIIDQLTKLGILNLWADRKLPIRLIEIGENEVLNITYVRNTGAAFSIFSEHTEWLAVMTAILLIGGIVFLYRTKIKSKLMFIGASMIIGGGVGNLIDRIFRGFVVDFIDFRIINFPIFNFADICVVVGVIIMLVYMIFFDEAHKKAPQKAESVNVNEQE